MLKVRLLALMFLIAGAGVGYFVYASEADPNSKFPFQLGLDLSGGVHLVYEADVSAIPEGEVDQSMEGLRDVIERRVNLFGVAEPVVQVEEGGPIGGPKEQRLIVELPGVTDVDAAIDLIGQTPLLEFKIERPAGETQAILTAQQNGERMDEEPYLDTGLTGRFLERAQLEFVNPATGSTGGGGGLGSQPVVAVTFNSEGRELFAQLTSEHTGKVMAIYLDGAPISTPVIQEEIPGGQAIISGNFTADEAKELVGRLNSGALPVPIELLTTQTIGPSLGEDTLNAGIIAGLWGLAAVAMFLLFWYRLPGLLAIVALAIYIVLMLAIFKLIPVTLTAAGIAGFILSVGMAVDANILIFERMKEELRNPTPGARRRSTKDLSQEEVDQMSEVYLAIREGFARAWLSIRDGNISSIITAIILFWFGTSLVEGFALTFGIGVLISMISAITISRSFLLAVAARENSGFARFLFGTGIK